MNEIKNALVLFPMEEADREKLEKAYPAVTFRFSGKSNPEDVAWADVIFGSPALPFPENCDRLKWIQLGSAGADPYTKPGNLPEGVILTNATGAYGLTISEHLMGVLLMLIKKMPILRDNQKKNLWQNAGDVKTLMGATVLVLGAGDIGTEFAKRVKPFGSTVIGVRRTPGEVPSCYDEMYLTADIPALLPRADMIVMALPGTPETNHIIGAKEIALMKDDAILINVGRGSAIDPDALCAALDAGKFWGVGLDVTEPEPLPSGHKLWSYDRVMITPHCSGGLSLQETGMFIRGLFSDNLGRLMTGEPLRNVVDFATGYRKR